MLTAYQIDVLRSKSEQLLDPVTDFLIEDIAKRISEAGQLTGTAAYQAWQLQKLGVSQRQLKKEIAKRLKVSQKEAEQLLTQAAETGYNFDLSRFPTSHAVPLSANSSLQQILDTTVKLAKEDLSNMTQTIGFVGPDGVCRELTDAYNQACDFAFQKVSTGAQDYMSAIRDATRNLAEKGIRTIDYESGVHTSMEAAVRRNIMGGLGLMQEQISQKNHDMLGCDGYEISAHAASAADHEPFQGRQYTDKEYKALNNSLVRRIGTLNCAHSSFPIILGVNAPQYTPEELEQMREDNETGVIYEGKHYSLYEATQRQRQLERAIRGQKRKILIDKTVGDEESLQTHQIRLQVLKQEYTRFSRAADLPMQHQRAEVAGFTFKDGKAAEKTTNNLKKELAKSSKSAKIELGRFNTTADPMREVTGCGLDSNPKEIQTILDDLKASGIEVRYAENNMAYAPGILPGSPGQFIIDRQASYSAWAHEYKHFCDDRADGFQGMRIFMDTEKCKQREIDAYNIEIELAKRANRPDIVERLEELKEAEVRRFDKDANAD